MSILLINNSISTFLYELASQNFWTESFSIFLSDGIFLISVCAYVFIIYPLRKKRIYSRTIFQDISPIVVTSLVVVIIKYFSHIERPFVSLGFIPFVMQPDTYGSFPSFHSSVFATFALTIFFHHRKFGIFLLSLLPLVMIGRIAIGVHWLSDVVIGAILGLFIAYLLHVVYCKVKNTTK
jgi:undecaprenyl-diphosphatase